MLQFAPTFVWVAVNLLILYFVLRKVLFVPVTQMLENRKNGIKASLDDAEKAKTDAIDLRRKYEEQIKAAKNEAETILNNARIKGDKEYDAIVSNALKHAGETMLKANEEIERDRQKMVKDIRNQVATLALSAASKVIEANMDTENNRAIVNKFIDEAGAA